MVLTLNPSNTHIYLLYIIFYKTHLPLIVKLHIVIKENNEEEEAYCNQY